MEYQEIPDWYKELRIKISKAVDSKSSVNLINVDDVNKTITVISEVFKEKGIKYRVVTKGRSIIPTRLAAGGAAVSGAAAITAEATILGPIAIGMGAAAVGAAGVAVAGVGVIALAGIGAHKLITMNCSYEIIKNNKNKDIYIVFKK
ncbi:hypothetical protein HLH36_19305 [Gluconacetobacter aggeris]|uniref:Uncharacterized protein n=1 Tax=Gluconacetobacter aggeris TaxID=1286186 RepID=A0A7W4IWR1_9PROT|nr:hypothetical protein [Gluconacetobacter aggeris]MBB2170448.1 hypothetical protein [Gluconacetobacter aggeris]